MFLLFHHSPDGPYVMQFQSLLDYESRKEGNDLYQLAQQNKTFQLMMMVSLDLTRNTTKH
jgi:hypothetical protein